MDVATIDQEYQQLQQEAQQTVQAFQELASKLQSAGQGGDTQAKEWVLDLKNIALQVQQEQLQVQALLQALHDFTVNNLQQPQVQQAQVVEQQPQGGGLLSHFRGGGFGQAMTQGIGMGAGFGLADSLIGGIFGN